MNINKAEGEIISQPKRLARIRGFLYLIVGIFGGFVVGYVSPMLYVPGHAATTAGNVVANAGLVRIAVVADLLQATVFVFLGMTPLPAAQACAQECGQRNGDPRRHRGDHDVSRQGLPICRLASRRRRPPTWLLSASRARMPSCCSCSTCITTGYLIAQIFFGLWLVPLGYLAYKSGMFPKALGIVLIVAGVSYLVDMLVAFLVPDLGKQIHGFLAIPPTIAEIWMLGYLLVKGVKVPAQDTSIVGAGKTSPVELTP